MSHQSVALTAKNHRWLCTIYALFLLFSSCKKEITEPAQEKDSALMALNGLKNNKEEINISPEMVIRWNTAAIEVVRKLQEAIPGAPVAPFTESRFYAMVNLAMHDALNNIISNYQTYALEINNEKYKNADPDAAVAQAAYEVINAFSGKLNLAGSLTPQSVQDYLDALLQQSMNGIKDAGPKKKGVELGHLAAQAILEKRANDNISSAMYAVNEGTQPGQYRFTYPFNFYLFPGWGNVTPFGLTSGAQFRPGAPYPVTSAEYAADFNEIKNYGRYVTPGSAEEQIAKFWVESSPQMWNEIALKIAAQKNLNAWQVARLFALLQMSEADAYIGSFDTKLHYFTWRPVTAIHLAADDNNPATTADPNWDVVGFDPSGTNDPRYWPTPPIADYTSAHAVAGGAGAEVIRAFFGSDNFSFSVSSTSTSNPTPRSFTSLSQAARENSLSRIYLGYHFRQAVIVGEQQGINIGKWIIDNYLKEE